MNYRKNKWVQWLHLTKWWYNSTYHTSKNMSPFEGLYGYPPPTRREYVINNFKVPLASDYLATSDDVTIEKPMDNKKDTLKTSGKRIVMCGKKGLATWMTKVNSVFSK